MKVLAINSSPRMDKGNTALILNPFLEGMKEAGAEVELFYTSKLKIHPCTGEFNCWIKTPGECLHNDDMKMLYPKIAEADVMVFAIPVYVDGVTGPMKNLIDDRMIPLRISLLRIARWALPPSSTWRSKGTQICSGLQLRLLGKGQF